MSVRAVCACSVLSLVADSAEAVCPRFPLFWSWRQVCYTVCATLESVCLKRLCCVLKCVLFLKCVPEFIQCAVKFNQEIQFAFLDDIHIIGSIAANCRRACGVWIMPSVSWVIREAEAFFHRCWCLKPAAYCWCFFLSWICLCLRQHGDSFVFVLVVV